MTKPAGPTPAELRQEIKRLKRALAVAQSANDLLEEAIARGDRIPPRRIHKEQRSPPETTEDAECRTEPRSRLE